MLTNPLAVLSPLSGARQNKDRGTRKFLEIHCGRVYCGAPPVPEAKQQLQLFHADSTATDQTSWKLLGVSARSWFTVGERQSRKWCQRRTQKRGVVLLYSGLVLVSRLLLKSVGLMLDSEAFYLVLFPTGPTLFSI